MVNILFLLNTFNDVDHIAPIIWKTVSEGDTARVVFLNEYDHKGDYRLNWIRETYDLPIHSFPFAYRATEAKSRFLKTIRELFWGRKFAKRFLRRFDITSCVFEWGDASSRGLRGQFFTAATQLDIPTFAVPHGCNIYLNMGVNAHLLNIKQRTGRWPDFSSRSAFDAYVLQSPYHLKNTIESHGQDPTKTFAWGSTRFFPGWAAMNLDICPPFVPAKDDGGRTKVVLMLPHWDYNVDQSRCIELIDRLVSLDWLYVLIKDHTRGTGGLSDSLRQTYNSLPNAEASVPGHSPSLIEYSDVVINFGSSIGVEALLQGKPLIYPRYLHTNETIYDSTKAAQIVDDPDGVVDIVRRIREGEMPGIDQEQVDLLFRELIYGGQEPHDVVKRYWEEVTQRRRD